MLKQDYYFYFHCYDSIVVHVVYQRAIPAKSIRIRLGSTAHWLQISPAQPEYKPIRAGQGRCGVTSYLSLSLSLWLSTNGIIPASFDSARIVTSRWRREVDPNLIPDALRWYSSLMLFINYTIELLRRLYLRSVVTMTHMHKQDLSSISTTNSEVLAVWSIHALTNVSVKQVSTDQSSLLCSEAADTAHATTNTVRNSMILNMATIIFLLVTWFLYQIGFLIMTNRSMHISVKRSNSRKSIPVRTKYISLQAHILDPIMKPVSGNTLSM